MTRLSAGASATKWETGALYLTNYGPYATLAVGTLLATLDGGPRDPWVTALLVAFTAGWVYVLHTRSAVRRGRPSAFVYFFGFLLLGALLILQHPLFFLVPVAAFFHVQVLGSAPMVFVGLSFASVAANSLIVYPEPAPGAGWIFGIVVVVQTVGIGLGVIGTEQIVRLSQERAQALAELERLVRENEGLHAQLVAQAREAGVADERQRLAREIHDTVAQGLMGVITQLEAAKAAGEPDRSRRMDNAAAMARESLAEARRAVRAATPLALEGRRLDEALGQVVSAWSEMNCVPAQLEVTGAAHPLHPQVEVSVLRVAQEALANVAKHAAASRVAVTLSYMADVVALDVRDDGAGFDPAALNGGFGLTGMRARAAELGGELSVETEPGGGTAVSLSLPAIAQETAT